MDGLWQRILNLTITLLGIHSNEQIYMYIYNVILAYLLNAFWYVKFYLNMVCRPSPACPKIFKKYMQNSLLNWYLYSKVFS